jgi:hypothetical protein
MLYILRSVQITVPGTHSQHLFDYTFCLSSLRRFMSQVIDSAALLPQHRERVYIVGVLSSNADQSQNQNQDESLRNFNKGQDLPFTWPDFPKLVISLFQNVLISCINSDFPSFCFFGTSFSSVKLLTTIRQSVPMPKCTFSSLCP